MGTVFITATGTDSGKTFVTAGLIAHLRRNGRVVAALKPVVTGFDPARPEGSDPSVLLTALGCPVTADEIARISPWRFVAPLAPDQAARREGRAVDFDALVAFSRKAARDGATLLIEGIGGVMVPLDERHTVLDWMVALGAPTVLVAGSYLGSISHTLTCLDVLHRHGAKVLAIIVNESVDSTVRLTDTIETISRFAHSIPVFGLVRNETAAINPGIAKIAELLS